MNQPEIDVEKVDSSFDKKRVTGVTFYNKVAKEKSLSKELETSSRAEKS